MIRLNFIAEELQNKRARKIRRVALSSYLAIWLMLLVYFFYVHGNSRHLLATYHQQTDAIIEKARAILPKYQAAARLIRQQADLQKELDALRDGIYEPYFVADLCAGINESLSANMWLELIDFAAVPPKQSGRKKRKKAAARHALELKGYVLLVPQAGEQDYARRFFLRLENRPPFSLAEGKLDLENLRVAETEGNYYYNFALSFLWPPANVK